MDYSVDILDRKDGSVRRTPMWARWTEHSAAMYHTTMCDCNLYGYRERGYVIPDTGKWEWDGTPHESVAWQYIKNHGCDHSMPPKRYVALRAILHDGREIDLTLEEREKRDAAV